MHDFRAFEYLYFRRRTEISPFVRCVFSSRVAGQQVFKLTVSLFSNSLGTNEVNASRGRTFGIKKKGEREDAGLRSIPVRDRHRRKKLDSLSPPLHSFSLASHHRDLRSNSTRSEFEESANVSSLRLGSNARISRGWLLELIKFRSVETDR